MQSRLWQEQLFVVQIMAGVVVFHSVCLKGEIYYGVIVRAVVAVVVLIATW